jgi:hypothetical protein
MLEIQGFGSPLQDSSSETMKSKKTKSYTNFPYFAGEINNRSSRTRVMIKTSSE